MQDGTLVRFAAKPCPVLNRIPFLANVEGFFEALVSASARTGCCRLYCPPPRPLLAPWCRWRTSSYCCRGFGVSVPLAVSFQAAHCVAAQKQVPRIAIVSNCGGVALGESMNGGGKTFVDDDERWGQADKYPNAAAARKQMRAVINTVTAALAVHVPAADIWVRACLSFAYQDKTDRWYPADVEDRQGVDTDGADLRCSYVEGDDMVISSGSFP